MAHLVGLYVEGAGQQVEEVGAFPAEDGEPVLVADRAGHLVLPVGELPHPGHLHLVHGALPPPHLLPILLTTPHPLQVVERHPCVEPLARRGQLEVALHLEPAGPAHPGAGVGANVAPRLVVVVWGELAGQAWACSRLEARVLEN